MIRSFSAFAIFFITCSGLRADDAQPGLRADPPVLKLAGPSSRHSILIHGANSDGSLFDLTRSAKFVSADPKIATVSAAGMVRGVGDGKTTIQVDVKGRILAIPVTIVDARLERSFHFENDIVPLLGRYGCNSSGCHGKAEGQNGFKLSVFGFDPAADYSALLKEARGRRVFPAAPEKSLILTKSSGQVPHGGGNRIPINSDAFETIRAWVAAGAPFGDAGAPRVESIRVEPAERIIAMRGQQPLRVIARWSDGREADVTRQARFQSNNEAVAAVSAEGLVQASDVPGEASVMAGFLNEVANFRIVVPRAGRVDFPKLPTYNFIDPLVDAKLKKLNVAPSGLADDNTFVRRVYLDIIGTLPTPDEVRAFIKDPKADKRARLIDVLLERPEYADFWALKWSDLLRVNREVLGSKRAYAYYRWIQASLTENKPFDRFTRELITAEGLIDEIPATNFYRVANKPGDAASTISQVFLGIRIACAECHHHPFDRWSQDDYYRMNAFFAPVAQRKIGNIETVVGAGDSLSRNPRTGESLTAAPLGACIVPLPIAAQMLGAKRLIPDGKGDQRMMLAEWMVSPRNPWFSRNVANRYWAHFLGRGIVEPVDDVRATNPPTNPELLDALAKHFDDVNYDLKKLIRTITLSRVYQTSSKPNESNERDEQNYSRSLFRRTDAEVCLDMLSQTTGVPEKFDGFPMGTRAIQLWDSKVRHYFLKVFGRPARVTSCECERNGEVNIAAVLHLLNSETVTSKVTHEGGMLARLVRDVIDDRKVTEELFMTFFSRMPTEKEMDTVLGHVGKQGAGKRKQAFEDIMWALMNSKEFMFNH